MADIPNDFVEDPFIKKAVDAALKKARRCMLERSDHMLIISYLAALIIYSDVRRSGIVQNMTISEYSMLKAKF